MTNPLKKPSIQVPGAVRRKAVGSSSQDLVRLRPLRSERRLPLLIEPAIDGVDLLQWADSSRELIDRALLESGGILFRGFSLASLDTFEDFVRRTSGEPMTYTYRSTPRTEVSGKVYTSTEYPAHQWIPMHNEMSYSTRWPMRIGFYCAQPSVRGGETPIADSRRVYERIEPRVRDRFAEQGVLYVRNYGGGLDVSWQEVFQTSDPAEVEGFCRGAGIEYEWRRARGGNRLRTRQVCQGVIQHPVTGEPVWFNQAHLFHVTSLDVKVREQLLSGVAAEDLPRNTYYGDGSPIPDEDLEMIRRVYREEQVVFPWQKGDLVLLDNVLTAHGRAPFEGPRRILVAMAGPGGSEVAA
jgi:alpha-ketoglutarate-dependent taurine dioxygenase